jgi:hypothetical protein
LLTPIRLAVPDVKAGDEIRDGRSFLTVLDVKEGDEKAVLLSVGNASQRATSGLPLGSCARVPGSAAVWSPIVHRTFGRVINSMPNLQPVVSAAGFRQ